MPEYIEREALLTRVVDGFRGQVDHGLLVRICMTISAAEPADVAPVKRGRWNGFGDDSTWACNQCGEPFILLEGTPQENRYNFCPDCGADMRGGKQDEMPYMRTLL